MGLAATASFLAGIPPLLVVLAVSVAAGVCMLVVFHFVSEPKKIRRAKDRMQAQLLAVQLFQDQLMVVVIAYGRLLKNAAKYMGALTKPALIVLVLLAPAIGWLDPYLGWEPLRPKQPFLVTVGLADTAAADGLELRVPPGITQSAPAVHIPAEHQVVWRLQAERDGTFPVSIVGNGTTIWKPVVVASGLARISAASAQGGWWERVLEPGTAALPAGSIVRSIDVSYAPREIDVWLLRTNWIIVFFVAAIGAALLLKKAFGVEI